MVEPSSEQPSLIQKPEDSAGYLLWQLTLLRQKHINHILKPLELTHAQMLLMANLFYLSAQQEWVTQVQLAEKTRTDVAMNSQILRGLERRELVKRSVHPQDARAKSVELTPAGRQLVEQAIPMIRASERSFFTLALEDEEYLQLKALLQKLYLNYRKLETEHCKAQNSQGPARKNEGPA